MSGAALELAVQVPRMRITSLWTLVALASIACSGVADSTPGAEAKAKPETAKASGTSAKTPTPETTPPPDTSALDLAAADKKAIARMKIGAVDKTELAARRTQMVGALNEGRKLVKAGDFAGGIAKYEALLAIDPHYGPALGELGWAEFNAEKYDDAQAHTQRALAETDDANKRGMLLYNLGRIAEARGQSEAALGHYQASLAARPNDVVAKRLAELQAVSPTPVDDPVGDPAARSSGLVALATGLADLAAMCGAIEADSLCSSASCERVEMPAGKPEIGMLHADDGMLGCWQPIMSTPSGWVVFEVAMINQHGSEVDQDVDRVTSRIEQNDAGEFLILEFSDHIYERVWSEADFESEDDEFPDWISTDREAVIVCRRDGAPACTSAITLRSQFTGPEDSGETSSYAASFSLRGDVIVIGEVSTKGVITLGSDGGGWDGYMTLPAGEYPFADLAKPSR